MKTRSNVRENRMKTARKLVPVEAIAPGRFRAALVLAVTILLGPQALPAAAPDVVVADKKVEQALLAEDWKAVTKLLASVNATNSSPVLRMIKGHACLALNRNNESMCLFLSVTAPDDRRAWKTWTDGFAINRPRSAIRQYLSGDALARLQRYQEAVVAFTQVLSSQPNHALILNARGGTHAAMGKLSEGFDDFLASSAREPRLAASFANLGMHAIRQKEGAQGALKDFNECLGLDPDFCVALYGRGCMNLVLGNAAEAKQDFARASTNSICLEPVIARWLHRDQHYYVARLGNLYGAQGATNPSMAIESSITRMDRNDLGFRGGTFREVKADAGWKGGYAAALASKDPKDLSRFENTTADYIKRNPASAPYIAKYASEVRSELQKVGTYSDISDTRSFSANVGFSANRSADTAVKGGSLQRGGTMGIDVGFGREITTRQDMRQIAKEVASAVPRADSFEKGLQTRVPEYQSLPKGFKTDPKDAVLDKGEWPFQVLFCPAYKAEAAQ